MILRVAFAAVDKKSFDQANVTAGQGLAKSRKVFSHSAIDYKCVADTN